MLTEKKINRILAAFVFIVSMLVYLRTIAPTTSFWDCGEFIACSYILGVPHPPGAPLYILIGRIFSMAPFVEDIGLRVNVISALTSGLTIMLTYLIIVRLIKMFRGTPKNLLDQIIIFAGGVIGSLLFAFTDTFWFNAVEAEVYAISMFFTAIVFWLILLWYEKADDPESDKYILMIAFCVGLAIGVHLLNILALPAIGLVIYFRKIKINWNTFLLFAVLMIITVFSIYPGTVKWIPNLALKLSAWLFVIIPLGLAIGIYYSVKNKNRVAALIMSSFLLIIVATSTYIAIYIRSNLNPAIDENDPETLKQMVSYLNREQYGDWSYVDRRAPLWEYQIKKMYLRYFGWQFIGQGTTLSGEDRRIVENFSLDGLWGLPFLVGLIGMFHHFRKDWKHASSILVLFLATGLAIVMYLNQDDPQPRERDYVYVGSFFAFTLWVGIGVTAILGWARETTRKVPSLQNIAIIALLILLTLALPINTIAHNFKSHDRSGNYVAYDYSYNILQSCEPDAILFTNGDNDTFPLWFLQEVYGIRKDVRVVNLSLLNTSWYIKQLKSQEPKVPISVSDKFIDQLAPQILDENKRMVKITVPKEAYHHDLYEVVERKELITPVEKPPDISFELKPTLMGRAIRVQDIMVINIIQANKFRLPVYFALTVSRESQLNMFKYLRMDGLTFKVVTYTGERISASKLRTNLFEKFLYRGLNDSTVYFNENIKGLLRNYQGAFFSLAQYYAQENMYDDMVATLDKFNEVMPDTIIPMREDLSYQMGVMYYQAGKKDEFKKRLDKNLNSGNLTNEEKVNYAGIYAQLFNETAKAEAIAKELISQNAGFTKAYSLLLSLYYNEKNYEKGIALLTDWLTKNPEDKNARQQLEQFQKLVSEPDTIAIDSVEQ